MAKLAALKSAMEEEMNSMTNALRNTFINRIPTTEEIAITCKYNHQHIKKKNKF